MPEAYFFTILAVLIISMWQLVRYVLHKYRRSFHDDSSFYNFMQKVFSSWDYSIADPDSAIIQCISIRNACHEGDCIQEGQLKRSGPLKES